MYFFDDMWHEFTQQAYDFSLKTEPTVKWCLNLFSFKEIISNITWLLVQFFS